MIYFVGAGPGDTELITVKGLRLLEDADVVIYAGSLINQELLKNTKKDALVLDSAYMTLDEVIDAMSEAFFNNKTLVRLHTGDTSIYSTIVEQIKRLKEKQIPYAIVPGVSSFSAVAAALETEYTLPEVTQSVIISRAEGRTMVPEREKLENLAKIGCSLVLFLSASMAKKISEELLKENSAYNKDTPCAVVYKASWKEEKIIRTTLSKLPFDMEKNGIVKTAIIVVGEVLGCGEKKISESKLYDKDFSTGYRTKKSGHSISIIGYTKGATELSKRISKLIPSVKTYSFGKEFSDTNELMARLFDQEELIIIVGACGMAVRLIAPFINDKAKDPAVLCIDDKGTFVISLLSGHLGGANKWCKKIADFLGTTAVITTATDTHEVFAVDDFAVENDLVFEDTKKIKEVSSRLLKGKEVGYTSDCGINITEYISTKKIFKNECRLYPKNLYVGMGSKKGKSKEELLEFLKNVFDREDFPAKRICGIYSIEEKKYERGLIELAKELDVDFVTYTAEELNSLSGDFSSSEFVRNTVGVSNVCERAAVMAASKNKKCKCKLIVKKESFDGMTIAIAQREI